MEDFVEYVKRYSEHYGIDEREALKHKIVQIVGYFYGVTDLTKYPFGDSETGL